MTMTESPPATWSAPARPLYLQIMEQTAADHGISVKAMCSMDRYKPLAWARFDCMARLRAEMRGDDHRYSFRTIGMRLGGRDHSTVMHGVNRWPKVRAQCHARLAKMKEKA